MPGLRDTLEMLESLARGAASEAGAGELRALTEAEVVSVLDTAARVQRVLDAVVVSAVGEVVQRSDDPVTEGRMSHRFGCASASELIRRVTRAASATVTRWQRVAEAVAPATSWHGDLLDARLPSLRRALLAGEVGVDGALAIAGPILATGLRAASDELLTADRELVAVARGEGVGTGPAPCADLLRVHALAWAEALDRDGSEPREGRMTRRRAVRLGRPTDDGVPVHGMLLPEVAAQLQTLFDAMLSPRRTVAFTEAGSSDHIPLDDRTRPQRQHDALATALGVAASSGLLPTIGGAAPTLVVQVRAEDLASGHGTAWVDGHPVSLATARHIGCSGVVQRITLDRDGRILRLGTEERVFNRHQRRAIALRDGGCIIPGCGIRAAWCEIHHVTEHAAGGPTHPDNGVLLCWYHHRYIDHHGWRIRMNRGVPEVQAPGWYDATLTWRAVTSSRTRLTDQVLRR